MFSVIIPVDLSELEMDDNIIQKMNSKPQIVDRPPICWGAVLESPEPEIIHFFVCE